MNCPNCAAVNPDSADWCSLCHTRFDSKRPDRQAEKAWEAVEQRYFEKEKKVPAGWTCPRCSTSNPIEADRCERCGARIFDAFGERRRPVQVRAGRSARVAAALSALPGAGHFYLGLKGDGAVRMLLGIWWFGLALMLRGAGPLGTVSLILFVFALGLAVVSGADAYRVGLHPGTAPLLNRTVILYSSLLVVGVLAAGAFLAMLSIRSFPR